MRTRSTLTFVRAIEQPASCLVRTADFSFVSYSMGPRQVYRMVFTFFHMHVVLFSRILSSFLDEPARLRLVKTKVEVACPSKDICRWASGSTLTCGSHE